MIGPIEDGERELVSRVFPSLCVTDPLFVSEPHVPFDNSALIPLLRCPKSHRPLVWDADRITSTDPATRLQFAIIDGIPDMLLEEATQLTVEQWSDVMRRHGKDPVSGDGASHA
jgi:uncharacterized protein